MKIGVIGASGKTGSLIAAEAKERGHDVTAIVRDPSKVSGKGYAVLEKDIYAITAEDVAGFDAVVDAFGTAFDPQSAEAHQTSMTHLIKIFEAAPSTRLLVVGGAGSLYTDPRKRHRLSEDIPEEWRHVPLNMAKAFENLQNSGVMWTYFSPAATFDPNGARTGAYTPGSDFVITNSANESYISYADYAVAMVDEIEDASNIRRRFTAVSERQTAPKDEYYGTEKKKPVFEGISRYRAPLNYELAGRQFSLVMDRGSDILVTFLATKQLEWTSADKTYREHYECGKVKDSAYFVNFELTGAEPRTNVVLVLDLQTRLVTVARSYTRYSLRYPTLVDTDFDFGAIDLPDFPLPKKRHGYTTDLVGKRIHWHYSPEFSIVHVYYHPNYIRATFTPEALKRMPPAAPEQREGWLENPYDEKAAYIKVRDGLYIVSIIEQSMARRGLPGNSLLFLMDTERVHDVGRSFGHTGQFGGEGYLPENYLFGAYGEFVYSDGGLESKPPFYTV
ncbi:MAG: NAD(P)H-binding protein [Clostridiales bacterium]|jgi:putative NADH-flavin reductase|nr:NAD(P)H-binding protein [Clostridiales bacterium]